MAVGAGLAMQPDYSMLQLSAVNSPVTIARA